MNHTELPKPINFSLLRPMLDAERKAILKVNTFSEQEEYVRSVEEAEKILDGLEIIDGKLDNLFKKNSSLHPFFTQDFGPYLEFISSDNILNLCFLDEFLFPEKEICRFVDSETGKFSPELLQKQITFLSEWCLEKEKFHEQTQVILKEKFNTELKSKELACQCNICQGEYRTRFRDVIFDECMTLVSQTRDELEEALETGNKKVGEVFKEFQKQLDKKFYSIRFKLKRSVISRLESQIKEKVRANFTYPAPLAKRQAEFLGPWMKEQLRNQNLRGDLISEEELSRFFTTLSSNIWRGDHYLESEFSKLVKTVLAFKRKDISANILKAYLGEFWLHSKARKIKRKIIYHMGPTNSGKTYHAIVALANAKKGCYLAPLRLLAGELYDTLNEKGVKTTLLTGEEVIEVDGATHYSSTIEMARLNEEFESCVIDEIQMISDPQRGWAWTRALVNIISPEIHICGDPSVLTLVEKIASLCNDTLEIKKYERMCELQLSPAPLRLGDLEKSDALIVFSRKNALKYKSELERIGLRVSIIYGRLSPEVRREQARKFDEGETDVIVSTDAIAMGMNLPIKRIIFSTLTKHIDDEAFPISPSEIKQIAGRAGRFNRFPIGVAGCLTKVDNGIKQISEAIQMVLVQKTQCMVGPDLDIFTQVNNALNSNALPELTLSEFLRLFNAMTFQKPFFCVDLKEMIELAEMVEQADFNKILSSSEIFGFACAPVNLGLPEHVQHYVWILNIYVKDMNVNFERMESDSNDIDYLETSIKCIELYQWLARHFDYNKFDHDELSLLENKSKAIEKLNNLLSEKIVRTCASCGVVLPEAAEFGICELCFADRKSNRYRRGPVRRETGGRPASFNQRRGGEQKNKNSDHGKSNTSGKKFSRGPSPFSGPSSASKKKIFGKFKNRSSK